MRMRVRENEMDQRTTLRHVLFFFPFFSLCSSPSVLLARSNKTKRGMDVLEIYRRNTSNDTIHIRW